MIRDIRNEPISSFDKTWGFSSPAFYGLEDHTYWVITKLPVKPVFGVASNDPRVAEDFRMITKSFERVIADKKLWNLFMLLRTIIYRGNASNLFFEDEEVNNFKFIYVCTCHESAPELDGRAMKIDPPFRHGSR